MSKREKYTSEEAILEAAGQEFMEKGFYGARTTSIAERAGVTHAMLHYYYRSKEQLFERIVSDKMSVIAASVMMILVDENLPLKERLEKGIAKHFDFLVSNPLLPRFLVNEVDRIHPIMVDIIKERFAVMVNVMQKEIDIDVRHLVLDILSQNVMPFLLLPIVEKIGFFDGGRDEMLERIKEENVTIILKRLGL